MKINEIRTLTGLSRVRFAERYNIPLRTVEDWEAGRSNPPEYIVPLLERAVRDDFGQRPILYYVTELNPKGLVEEEYTLLVTKNIYEAQKAARDEAYINERDKTGEKVEIRVYVNDIEDENCTCFDYDTVEF